MTTAPSHLTAALELIEPALVLAEQWQAASAAGADRRESAASDRLAHLVADPQGLELAVAFVDDVARPQDTRVAAHALAALPTTGAGAFLSPVDRLLLRLGRRLAPLLPDVVVPAARARLRQLVGHLVADARDPQLARHLARARSEGFRLNVNLLGEAVLGEQEAASRVARTIALVERDDVDYVSIKVSSLVSQISTWDTPGTLARVVDRLRPLYRAALATGAFVNLDMEEYRDLDLTLEVFTTLLAEPELADLEAGIVLQAYLPDAPLALERLITFAQQRVAAGGRRIKVRLVKGANLAMERVEAQLHGWEQAPHHTKAGADATYVAMLDRVLTPEVARVMRLGVAGHNLPHLALAHLLATRRGVAEAMDVEMLQGMSPAQARAVRDTVGQVLLYTPVVAPEHFDVAVSYLVRRLEENASPENYLHQSISQPGRREARERFIASVHDAVTVPTTPHRTGTALLLPPQAPFRNAPDSDPALAVVRERVTRALATPRNQVVAQHPLPRFLASPGEVDEVVARGRGFAADWQESGPALWAQVLAAVGNRLAGAREDLLAIMAHEAGKAVAESDPEVSEAIDFARYYAASARALATPPAGLRFRSVALTLVTPPWNFPVAITVGGVLAALAAGSAVVLKPSPQAPRCGMAVGELVRAELRAHGLAPDLVQIVQTAEDEVGQHLVAHQGVDQVVLTGAGETAQLFAGWRSTRASALPGGPRVFAETSGKNALVVTPSADLDLAVADVVRSAFGNAGQKCSAASLLILVGSVGRSRRFHSQLLDAMTSLRVGLPQDLGTGMGPVIAEPGEKLRRGLTQLCAGESWAVRPREVSAAEPASEDDDGAAWLGRLWTPGVRVGVAPGSWFHHTECFGPVLGVMRADSLAEAVAWQNATAYGLTGGLHSLDPAEIEWWLEHVEVGNAYVNRHITGAVVQRQPFGGWKGSTMGPGAKAGGPHYVAQLGWWEPVGREEVAPGQHALADTEAPSAAPSAAAVAPSAAVAEVAAAMLRGSDVSALPAEENTLRYRPVPHLVVRVAAGAGERGWRGAAEVVRLAELLGVGRVSVSLAPDIPADQAAVTAPAAPEVVTESEEEFAARLESGPAVRVRWIAGARQVASPALWTAALASGSTVLDGPVLPDAAIELHRLVREQAISRTRHRYGHVHS